MAVEPLSTTGPRRGRLGARWEAFAFGLVVSATDLLPPRIRYGYVHRLTRRVFQRQLSTLRSTRVRPAPPVASPTIVSEPGAFVCAMITGSMDVGGIGSVVEMLATAFPGAGVGVVVVCTEGGARAARLRSQGITVVVSTTEAEAEQALRELAPAVIQLHGAPDHLENAAISSGIPLVPVLHNTEIHYSGARWRRFAGVLSNSRAAIAVSESVREFHAAHVPEPLRERIHVVANAVHSEGVPSREERQAARADLERALQADLTDQIVLATLIRYDSQKNVAGLVSSFLSSVTNRSVRLVIAGDTWDWAEYLRADAIRRCSVAAERVTLLGQSDARALLAAADGFILDSFFEGWPMAATEAAAMGLPLILADFGGARELIGRDSARSILIPNACGPADAVSDAAVAHARRRSRHQSNAGQLGAAVDVIAGRPRGDSRLQPESADTLLTAMVAGHAEVLRRAASQHPHKALGLRAERSVR
jgi:glycosyltransferase involved in cell wall biosynthesis